MRSAELLHAYGTPAHRLERVVSELGEHFALDVQVFSTPTSIFLGFEGDVPDRVRLLRVAPGGVDLGKLTEISEILEDTVAGRLTAHDALERINELDSAAPRWSAPTIVLGHALAAGSAAVFFGGGGGDVVLSACLGAMIGGLEILASRREGVAGVFEPLSAALAAAAALVGAHLSQGAIDDRVVALAAIIVLVPGLSLTVALTELATRHLASGTARLSGAGSVFLTIAFGALFGRLAVTRVMGPWEGGAMPRAAWAGSNLAVAAAVMVAALGFSLLFRVRPKELPWVFGSCAVGVGTTRLLGVLLAESQENAAIAAFTGALAVGVFANAYARMVRRPATVPLVPGLLVLVPGSVGYRALSAFTEHNALTGLEATFQMVLLAAALVGGLLTANAVLPPRRNL